MRFSWGNQGCLGMLLFLLSLVCSCKTSQPGHARYDYAQTRSDEIQRLVDSHDKDFEFPVHAGNISCDTMDNLKFVQFDSVRVFLWDDGHILDGLFCRGKLYPSLIYCQLDSACKPPDQMLYTTANDTAKRPFALFGWTGHTVQLLNVIELIQAKTKPKERYFEVWVYPEIFRPNPGSYVFILKLENPDANRKTDLITFLSGAQVKMFKYFEGML